MFLVKKRRALFVIDKAELLFLVKKQRSSLTFK